MHDANPAEKAVNSALLGLTIWEWFYRGSVIDPDRNPVLRMGMWGSVLDAEGELIKDKVENNWLEPDWNCFLKSYLGV